MMRRRAMILAAVLLLAAPLAARAGLSFDPAVDHGTVIINGVEMAFYKVGGGVPNAADYDWWYGCSPTAVGMIMGHYDRQGYGSQPYDNLVPGGVAEIETHYGPPVGWAALTPNIIASQEHVNDFYSSAPVPGNGAEYGASGDDVPQPWHDFNCLADFMGTSQDAQGNSNATTTFWNFTDGSPLHYDQVPGLTDNDGNPIQGQSGMYGIYEYIRHSGYDVATLYNQYILGWKSDTLGFTLEQYKAEIDAGRPVLIHVEDHSLAGVGYSDELPDRILVNDTWSSGPHLMTWGGSYSGLQHYGVTVLEMVPEPATLALLGLGGLMLLVRRRGR